MAGITLAAAAAAAGMSERAARKWQSGALPSTAKSPRTWRTREDPFADVWQSEVVPQLVADTDGRLQVLTLFKALCGRHPDRYQPGQLRTLQRRVRDWRVQYGPDRRLDGRREGLCRGPVLRVAGGDLDVRAAETLPGNADGTPGDADGRHVGAARGSGERQRVAIGVAEVLGRVQIDALAKRYDLSWN